MSIKDRITIITGTDRSPVVRLRNPKTGDPLDLTSATKIQFEFTNRNRSKLVLDNTEIPATRAQITVDNIIFIADNAGSQGNDIILQFDGVNDVTTVVSDWNTANPTNTVSHNGTGTEIISLQTVRLTDGFDAFFPVEINGDPQLGKVIIRLLEKDTNGLKRGPNQTFIAIIDYGTNPGGTRIKGFYSKLDVVEG